MTRLADIPEPLPGPPVLRALDAHLIGLHPGTHAELMAFAERGRTDTEWIIGVKAVSGAASVHASHWERHPRGEEVLVLLDGRVCVILDGDAFGPMREVPLSAGQMLLVPRGAWHRLRVQEPGHLLFVTPSQGSEHRRVGAA